MDIFCLKMLKKVNDNNYILFTVSCLGISPESEARE